MNPVGRHDAGHNATVRTEARYLARPVITESAPSAYHLETLPVAAIASVRVDVVARRNICATRAQDRVVAHALIARMGQRGRQGWPVKAITKFVIVFYC
jgi:hypothetical protein